MKAESLRLGLLLTHPLTPIDDSSCPSLSRIDPLPVPAVRPAVRALADSDVRHAQSHSRRPNEGPEAREALAQLARARPESLRPRPSPEQLNEPGSGRPCPTSRSSTMRAWGSVRSKTA